MLGDKFFQYIINPTLLKIISENKCHLFLHSPRPGLLFPEAAASCPQRLLRPTSRVEVKLFERHLTLKQFEITVELTLCRCLCAEAAEVAWSIDGKEINEDDEQYATSSCDGEQLLEIVQPLVSDTATFSCRSHLDKITSHL